MGLHLSSTSKNSNVKPGIIESQIQQEIDVKRENYECVACTTKRLAQGDEEYGMLIVS